MGFEWFVFVNDFPPPLIKLKDLRILAKKMSSHHVQSLCFSLCDFASGFAYTFLSKYASH